jgi:hypothetical protein
MNAHVFKRLWSAVWPLVLWALLCVELAAVAFGFFDPQLVA